jgi:hypothetical protein
MLIRDGRGLPGLERCSDVHSSGPGTGNRPETLRYKLSFGRLLRSDGLSVVAPVVQDTPIARSHRVESPMT